MIGAFRLVVSHGSDIYFFIGGIEREAEDVFSELKTCFTDASPAAIRNSAITQLSVGMVVIVLPWILIAVLNGLIYQEVRTQAARRHQLGTAVSTIKPFI